MLVNALVKIGEALKEETLNKEYDPEIVKFIDLKYPKPPKTDKIIRLVIRPSILECLDKIEKRIQNVDLSNYIEKAKNASKEER
ncbi:MAG: hypothetical protein ACTSX4_03400 [Candidatus Helarchaeota archaeon]